ncbi:hypothetical protein Droror1_Dr00016609, partial [Drosera rotundifolia]
MLSKLGKEAGYRSDGGGHSSLLGPLRGPPLIYLRGTRHPAGSSLALPGGSVYDESPSVSTGKGHAHAPSWEGS